MDTKEVIIIGIILSTATSILAALILKHAVRRAKSELRFSISDIADPAGLLLKLTDAQDAVSQYIWWRLPDNARSLVEKYDRSRPPSESLLESLVGVLNQLLSDRFLFDERRCANLALRKETQKLITEGPQEEDLFYFNRMLIEDAYSSEIVKRTKKRYLSLDARIVTIVLTIFVFATVFGARNFGATLLSKSQLPESAGYSNVARPSSVSSVRSSSPTGYTGKLGLIIKQQQEAHVGESSGWQAHDNFTEPRWALFKRDRTIDKILSSLEEDPEFLLAVEEIKAMPPNEREALLNNAELAYSPTWEQLGMDSTIQSPEDLRKGQTRAGQMAERMIAEKITNLVRAHL